jgi:hypothetical protein
VAIDQSYLKVMDRAIRDFLLPIFPKPRAACLGYPDLIVKKELLLSLFGEQAVALWPMSKWAREIVSWHRLPEDFGTVFDSQTLFDKYGIDVKFFDFMDHRNCEETLDLNHEISHDHKHAFDLLVDTGTLEHCFNVGIAFRNMCEMTSLKGIVISAAPLTKVNHGFWCFSPTAYFDGFVQNGFKILLFLGVVSDAGKIKFIEVHPIQRVILPPESIMIVVARREVLKDFTWPVQSKYQKVFSK